ncbi:response regulator, partial [Vibrio sp. FNV 38]|nr:response regulator [Vibrio sp. FNV 38]
MDKGTVLLVEDDLYASRIFKNYFESKGILVEQCFDIGSAFRFVITKNIDVIVLDNQLPTGQGVDFVAALKKITTVPIIAFTATEKVTLEEKFLKQGVDDYVQKSRGLPILYLRIVKVISKSNNIHITDNNGN